MFGVVTMDRTGLETCWGQTPTAEMGTIRYNANKCASSGWGGRIRLLPRAPFVIHSDLGGVGCGALAAPTFAVAGASGTASCFAAKVMSYQTLRGLTPDGKLGKGTLAALKRDAGILKKAVAKRAPQADPEQAASPAKAAKAAPLADEVAMSTPALVKPGSTLMASMMGTKGLLIVGGGLLAVVALVKFARSRS